MRKLLHNILFTFCLIASALLLISYLAPLVSPETITFVAFTGLAYPYLLAANVLFLIYWIFRRRWSFLLPLIAIALGYNQFANFIQFNSQDTAQSDIKIMTYNVRLFDKYNWNQQKSFSPQMLQLLKDFNCDIYCIQEYRPDKTGTLSIENIKKATNCKYAAVAEKQNDLAIFSKYPILLKRDLHFDKGDMAHAIFADIQINKKKVRVYNLHLQSYQLRSKDYTFMQQKEFDAEQLKVEEFQHIYQRLNNAFIRRARQAEMLSYHISQSPYPVLVCGDFNDTAFSYTYKKIKGNQLTDAFRERGTGISVTYIGDFPSFRIDFMLHSNRLVCNRYKCIQKKYSDHYPVYAELSFK